MPGKPDMPRIGLHQPARRVFARVPRAALAAVVLLSATGPSLAHQSAVATNDASGVQSIAPHAENGSSGDRELEAKPLGRPNGPLSARPPTSTDTQGLVGAGTMSPMRNDLTRVLGALAAVIGLLLLIKTVLSRWRPALAAGSQRPSGVIEVLARYPMGRGQSLLVLKFARRVLLLHQSGAVCRTLTEMTEANEVAGLLSRLESGARDKDAARFRATLASFESEHDAAAAETSRAGAALAAEETHVIDLTRTRIVGGASPMRRGASR